LADGHATNYDPIVIGGDLLDLTSALNADIQILVMRNIFIASGSRQGYRVLRHPI